MKKLAVLLVIVMVGLSASLVYMLNQQARLNRQLVAASWGDGQYGKAMYGAYVYYEEENRNEDDKRLAVKAIIYIGRPELLTSYTHSVGTLGFVANPVEAVSQWGKIIWNDQAVVFGNSADKLYAFPRTKFENHR